MMNYFHGCRVGSLGTVSVQGTAGGARMRKAGARLHTLLRQGEPCVSPCVHMSIHAAPLDQLMPIRAQYTVPYLPDCCYHQKVHGFESLR